MKAYVRNSNVGQPIPNLGTRRKWVVKFTPRPLELVETTKVPIEYEVGWVPELAFMFQKREKSVARTGIGTLERPALSQSLYRLSYPDSPFLTHVHV